MVKEILVKKVYDKCVLGKYYGEKHYDKIIDYDCDCYWIDDNKKKKCLFKLRKKVIPGEYNDKALDTFLAHTKSKGSNRGYASGFLKNGKVREIIGDVSVSKKIQSNISGYFDRPTHGTSHLFDTKTVCRTTMFTRDNKEKWENSIPFFILIDKLYKKLAPVEYKKQKKYIETYVKPRYRISNTVFTTITSNYNWRTACHKDEGDFLEGMGNLIITGDDKWENCYLGFPEFKIGVDVKKCDFLLMDVHQYHCNTKIKVNKGVRLSFVCYLRRNMKFCKKKKVIINRYGDKEIYHYKTIKST